MSAFNPDDIFEKWTDRLSIVWGPFYAVFYILRLFWAELFRRNK